MDHKSYLLFIIILIQFICLYKKQTFLYYPTFIIIYLTLTYFFTNIQNKAFLYNGILMVPMQYSVITAFIIALLILLTTCMYTIYCKKKILSNNFMYDITIKHHQTTINLKALLDSGNEVYYQGYPLIIINKKHLQNQHIIDTLYTTGVVQQQMEITIIQEIIINKQSLKNVYVALIENIDYDCLLNKQLMGGVI